jgi:MFS transporter, DHA2 family, multidrug resistance protein
MQSEAPHHVNPWIIAIAVMFGTFMEVLDTTVVNVSLPHIAGSLSATVEEATWVLTSYLVANAIILPITGWLASRFGRKRLLITAVFWFTAASFMCGFAPNLPFLVFFRIVQGAAGGTLQPLSQAVLLESFRPEDRGKAMGFWGLGIVVAPILGPVLGGWITETYSWRWVFYINIPVGAVSIFMVSRFVFDPSYIRQEKRGIDYWGIGLLALWIGAMQVVLDKGEQEDWLASGFIKILLFITVFGLIAFLIREFTARDPVVHLSVFRNRTYTAGVILMTIVGVVLYGSLVLLPIWLQTLLGYSSYRAGIALAPRGMGSMLAMPLVGAILARFDPRRLLTIGIVIGAFTLYQFSLLDLSAGYWDFFWPQFIQGISLALLFVPLTTITMSPIPKEEMGNATSLFNLMRNLGGSFGIAAVTTLQARYQQKHINVLGAHVTPFDPAASQVLDRMRGAFSAAGSGPVESQQQALASLWGMVQRQAAMLSFVDVFRLMAIAFLFMLPLVFLMKKPPTGASVEIAH